MTPEVYLFVVVLVCVCVHTHTHVKHERSWAPPLFTLLCGLNWIHAGREAPLLSPSASTSQGNRWQSGQGVRWTQPQRESGNGRFQSYILLDKPNLRDTPFVRQRGWTSYPLIVGGLSSKQKLGVQKRFNESVSISVQRHCQVYWCWSKTIHKSICLRLVFNLHVSSPAEQLQWIHSNHLPVTWSCWMDDQTFVH